MSLRAFLQMTLNFSDSENQFFPSQVSQQLDSATNRQKGEDKKSEGRIINGPKTKSYLAALVSARILLYFSDYRKCDETLATLMSRRMPLYLIFSVCNIHLHQLTLSAKYLFLSGSFLPQAELVVSFHRLSKCLVSLLE